MQRIKELLLLLFVCGSVSFLLHWRLASRPTLISGTVINWITGQPVAGVMVCWREMNGSSEAAWTDVQGRFSAVLPNAGRLYTLYAAGPRFGPLLQSTFGRTVVVYTPGEQHSDVVVPAIPATEISGHVYDEGSTPLPGCDVWALTNAPDQTSPLQEVHFQFTDGYGAFAFTELGADRYFVLVRCHRYLPGERQGYNGVVSAPSIRNSWQPMLFPQADSLNQAKAIVLLPGDRRRSIDFHLRSVIQYSVHGKVIFSDRSQPKPYPYVIYSHSLQAVPLDPALAVTAPGGEACDWNANTGDFHCDFLSPGVYKLTFSLDGIFTSEINRPPVAPQRAEVNVEVKAKTYTGPELTVYLQDQKPASWPQPETPVLRDGFLHLQRVCPPGIREGLIVASGWGPTRWPSLYTAGLTSCAEDRTWPLSPGAYIVAAYQADFFNHGEAAKIQALLREHGKQVSIHKGGTSYVSVPVWSTDQIIRWAIESLREKRS